MIKQYCQSKPLFTSAILLAGLSFSIADAAGIGVEGQVQANASVPADENLSPEENAVVSGVNTTPSPSRVDRPLLAFTLTEPDVRISRIRLFRAGHPD
ncbi:hypothetical protein [Thiolapillus sp.]|nr:hypothetical protein [Thiolapillus sp.]